MFPAVQNNTLVALNGLNGRCGWICRRLKDIRGIAAEIPIVGNFINAYVDTALSIVAAVDDVLGVGAMQRRIGSSIADDYEPTVAENLVLDAFMVKLKVFYADAANQIGQAFANNNFDVQLQQINDGLLKLCIIKQHFATKEVKGLSPEAVALRLKFLEEIIKPIEDLIEKSVAVYETKITPQNYTYTLNSSNFAPFANMLNPVQAPGTFSCMKYVDSGIKNNAPGATTNPTVTVPGTTTPVTTNPTTTTTKNKSLLTPRNILLGVLLLYGGYELTKDDKKKK
ncbi:hypothetical protein ACI6PS_03550 [Flavobacterium sp. PLA-1-15]|uniref:hypothetical protein n=1 Tax=Flavobacterium sp. PLA-1-15 TaxID=3380533 RepID=UPI003B7EFCC5